MEYFFTPALLNLWGCLILCVRIFIFTHRKAAVSSELPRAHHYFLYKSTVPTLIHTPGPNYYIPYFVLILVSILASWSMLKISTIVEVENKKAVISAHSSAEVSNCEFFQVTNSAFPLEKAPKTSSVWAIRGQRRHAGGCN